jgi:hypothetical protein
MPPPQPTPVCPPIQHPSPTLVDDSSQAFFINMLLQLSQFLHQLSICSVDPSIKMVLEQLSRGAGGVKHQ